MLVQSYPTLPTVSQWKKDSSVGNLFTPKRSADPTLLRIDRMVNSLNQPQSAGEYAYKLGGLFFTTMYWNNNHKINTRMDSGRRDSILRLNLWAGNKLGQIHQCGVGGVAMKLHDIYGKSMDEHGITTDGPGGQNANYLNALQRERFRVIFRNGLAYRFSTKLSTNPNTVLTPWDTTDFYEADQVNTEKATGKVTYIQKGEGISFVFSMSHELFVGHIRGIGSLSYHSSFMGGATVQCAGSIAIKQGVITRLKNDSGHYKPKDEALAQVLRHLKTVGVNINKITVEEEVKKGSASGDQFLAANGNWAGVLRPHTHFRH